MSILGLTFLSPFVLIGLLALPAIWWLLRLTPPRPREEVFPPTRILQEIERKEETPAHSPWWLTLLRLVMTALVILALSEPVWNAQEKELRAEGPVLMIVEDGWATGRDWDARISTAERLLKEAQDAERPVALVFTSEGAKGNLSAGDAANALERIVAAQPSPLQTDLAGLAQNLGAGAPGATGSVIWLSDGLNAEGSSELASAIGAMNVEEVLYFAGQGRDLLIATGVNNAPDALEVVLRRVETAKATDGQISVFDVQERQLSQSGFSFDGGSSETVARFDIPVELRNEIVRISIANERNAGAVRLLDERFRRRRVGLISGAKADQAQPLLSPLYYISRALAPFSEVREADDANLTTAVPQLIGEGTSTLVLADIGQIPEDVRERIDGWIRRGGMLVRFAGPRLASAQNDSLVPVELRGGGRSLGGTLTWGTAQPLSNFSDDSPFAGIDVPEDVTVMRQVLAEPSVDLAEKTWASLADGTPLVTASQRGAGWIVLFHVTADANWSNLPLSGAFVDMLRRIVAVSNGAIAADRASNSAAGENAPNAQIDAVTLAPLRLVDGFGRLGPPSGNARPLTIGTERAPEPNAETPPGLYGTNDAFVALNLFDAKKTLAAFDTALLPAGTRQGSMSVAETTELKPWMLGLAMLLLALDCLAVLWMGGALRRKPRLARATAVLLGLLVLAPQESMAQDNTADFENTLRTRLAYVKTGIQRQDEISRKGLRGLTQFIASRTSLEPADPVGVDIASDELAFFPLLYWPVSAETPIPDAAALARVDAFMKKGGSVLFDTKDQLSGGFGGAGVSAATQRLRDILSTMDVPPLEPVPDNHVLTRAFYLLNVFPGRYLDGRLWVETSAPEEPGSDRPTRQGDGVSSIMITSNDLAGAWAIEADGAYSLPVVPPNPTQRTYAYRTGVNIVMYTLTGNYKSDQVHIPALLERLGQ